MSDDEIFSVLSDLSSIQADPPVIRSVCEKCRYSYFIVRGMHALVKMMLNELHSFQLQLRIPGITGNAPYQMQK